MGENHSECHFWNVFLAFEAYLDLKKKTRKTLAGEPFQKSKKKQPHEGNLGGLWRLQEAKENHGSGVVIPAWPRQTRAREATPPAPQAEGCRQQRWADPNASRHAREMKLKYDNG